MKIGLAAVIATGSFSALAGNYVFVAGDSTPETKLCVTAAENDVFGYRKSVNKFGFQSKLNTLKHKAIANQLKCNGQNLAAFTQQYGAEDMAEFISPYLNQSVSITRDAASLDSATPQVIVVTAK